MTVPDKPFNEPSEVKIEDATVKVRGPDEVEVDLTPEAAEETSERLLVGAMKARGHRRLNDLPHKPK